LSEMFRVEYYSTLGALFFAAVHNTNSKLWLYVLRWLQNWFNS
jgi:hypothetical protein